MPFFMPTEGPELGIQWLLVTMSRLELRISVDIQGMTRAYQQPRPLGHEPLDEQTELTLTQANHLQQKEAAYVCC
jgi:hypothetical protein